MTSRIFTFVAVACCATGVTEQLRAQNVVRPTTRSSARSNRGVASLAPTAAETNPSGQYSASDLEDLRTQLLNLTDAVGQLAVLAPDLVDQDSLQQAKTQFQQMPQQYLNTLRQGISPTKLNTRLAGARQSLKSYADARAQRVAMSSQKLSPRFTDATTFPAVTEFCMSQGSNVSANQSTSGFGATGGSGSATSASTQNPVPGADQQITSPTGGTYDPASIRIPTAAVLAADVVRFVADTVKDLSQDACKQDILGENASLACLVVDALAVVADAVDEGIHFCDDDLTANVIDTSYVGLKDVHDDLYTIGTSVDTHVTNTNLEIDTRIGNLDTHLTNVDTHITNEFVALTTTLQTLIANLSAQVTAATNLLNAALQQIMKLDMTPDGQRQIILSILSCDGTSVHPCPAPLAACLKAGTCSWNNVGPLP